jgi:hypothetical protein
MPAHLQLFQNGPRAVRDIATGEAYLMAAHDGAGAFVQVSRFPLDTPEPPPAERMQLDRSALADWLARIEVDQPTEEVLGLIASLRRFHAGDFPHSAAEAASILRNWAAIPELPKQTTELIRSVLTELTS